MSTISPELQTKIAVWRQKAVEGTLSRDEMREAILALRGDRKSAAEVSEQARRTRARKEIKSADELLNELDLI